MKKELLIKTLTMGIVVLFVGTGIASAFNINSVNEFKPVNNGNWLYVGGSGPNNYTRIQDAIENATDGDIVFVYYGTYNEHITVDKQLTVIGITSISEEIPYIDGGDYATVLITADNCIFENFSVSSDWWNGIRLQSNGNVIRNCSVLKATGGDIKLDHSSNNLISDNIFRGGVQGILLENSSHNTIINNIADSHDFTKLSLWSESNYNLVCNNEFSNSGAWEGILNDEGCSYNIYKNNKIWNNADVGIYIESGYGISIIENSFMNNGIGFSSSIDELLSYTIENNTINDKNIYFYKNKNDVIVPSDAGQIFLLQCTGFTIKNLNISNVRTGHFGFGGGICLINSSCTTIQETSISYCLPVGIYMVNSDDNTISSNILFKNNHGGIYCGYSTGNEFSDNIIQEGEYEGIHLYHSPSNTIKSNTISGFADCIELHSSSSIIVNKNTITNRLKISMSSNLNQVSQNHIQGGVEISGGSSSNEISNNDISNGGILLEMFSNSNKIFKNNITNSEFGVYIIGCQLNTIKTNNFINNNVQAYFEDTLLLSILPDFWRRNYWEDWNGITPKRIEGKMIINHFSFNPDPEYQVPPTIRSWSNFDWLPAKKPYDIGI